MLLNKCHDDDDDDDGKVLCAFHSTFKHGIELLVAFFTSVHWDEACREWWQWTQHLISGQTDASFFSRKSSYIFPLENGNCAIDIWHKSYIIYEAKRDELAEILIENDNIILHH